MSDDLEAIFPVAFDGAAEPPAPVRHEVLKPPHPHHYSRIGGVLAMGLMGVALGTVLTHRSAAPPAAPASSPAETPLAVAAAAETPVAANASSLGSGIAKASSPRINAAQVASPAPRTIPVAAKKRRPAPVERPAVPPHYEWAQPRSEEASSRHDETVASGDGSLDGQVSRAYAVAVRAGVDRAQLNDYRQRWDDLRGDPSWRPSHRPAAYQALVNRLRKAAAQAERKGEGA